MKSHALQTIKLWIALILMMSGFPAYPQSADDVITKHLEKTGGVERRKGIKTWKLISTISRGESEFTRTVYEKPNAIRIESTVAGFQTITAYNGSIGWVLNPTKDPIKLNEEQLKNFLKSQNTWENDFIDYKEKGHEATLLGTEELDGIACFKIQFIKNKFNDREDIKEIAFFDSETYFQVMQITYSKVGSRNIEIISTIGDHHDVDGFMFPFYTESKVDGQSIQLTIIEKIIINGPMDDSIFEFPKK